MAWIRICRTAAASALILAPVPSAGQPAPAPPPAPAPLPASANALEVRIDKGYAASIVGAVAEIGRPTTVRLGAQDTVRSVMEMRCGIVDPVYVLAFLKENRRERPNLALADLDGRVGGAEFRFPACLPPTLTPTPVVPPLGSVGSIASFFAVPMDQTGLEAALAGPSKSVPPQPFANLDGIETAGSAVRIGQQFIGFVRTENARRFVRINPEVKTRLIPEGKSVFFDTGLRAGTVPLRVNLTLQEAEDILTKARANHADLPSAQNKVEPAELIGDAPLPAEVCKNVETDLKWPYDPSELRQAVLDNRLLRLAGPKPAVVLVADTGIRASTLDGSWVIPKDSFGRMKPPNSQGLANQIGVNAAREVAGGQPPSNLPNADHGAEVAATLLGRATLRDALTPSEMPTLTFASLAVEDWTFSYLDPNAVSNAYRQAMANEIGIVNASIAATPPYTGFQGALGDKRYEVVVITAAGNVKDIPADFDDSGLRWPGGLGGAPSNAKPGLIVSVGAHDDKGKVLAFSRVNNTRVDLLAPGCKIPTYRFASGTDAAELTRRNGTSYAAPIVSLVAAQMRRETLSPVDIKNRLLASTDVDLALEPYVYSLGRLNIRKALSVWRDRLVYRVHFNNGGSEVRELSGILDSPLLKSSVCGKTLEHRQILQLVRARDSQDPTVGERWIGWATSIDSNDATALRRINCSAKTEPSGDEIAFLTDGPPTRRPETSGAPPAPALGAAFEPQRVVVSVKDVIDYTAAWQRPDATRQRQDLATLRAAATTPSER